MSHRIASLALALVLGSASIARADLVTDWNLVAVQAANTLPSPSNKAPRVLAIAHIAVHNALAAVDQTYAPYQTGTELTVTGPVSREAAVIKAFLATLSILVPAKKVELTERAATALAAIPDGPAKTNGIALGDAAAAAILSLRAADGSSPPDPAYLGSTDVGKWRPTGVDASNNPVPGVDPNWVRVVPFALASNDAFRAPAPPAVNSAAYLTDLAEVHALGAKQTTDATTSTRTANQTEIAKFWEFPTHNPFNAIARQVAKREALGLAENARLFAQLNIALSDVRVAVWESKYFYSTWRPLTAIVTGDGAEDDGSTTDAAWAPTLTTPAHPEYPSGHSATGAAGAAVLRAWFGDEVEFTVASDSLPEVTRSYTSFTQAQSENGRSRIYGGIHFQYANTAGQALGKKVGEHVIATQLAALPPAIDAGAGDDAGAEDAGVDGGEPDAAVADAGAPDAGQPVADAGPGDLTDAGQEPTHDAGAVGEDAGAGDDEEDSSSCAVAYAGGGRGSAATLAGLALAVLSLRRRRSRRA